MSLITDLLNELRIAQALEKSRVDGGEDLIDTVAGNSSLSPETLAFLRDKQQWEQEQLSLITTAIGVLESLAAHSYPDRKVFDVPPDVSKELDIKLQKMREFSSEFRPIKIGADTLVITESPATLINVSSARRSAKKNS